MEKFDYVIVGGGTAGCVLANRLTADPKCRVLLLEAGDEGKNFWVNVPAGFGKLLSGARFNWRFNTEQEPGTGNRRIVVPRGKGLGGSSLINGMIVVRGQEQDFDAWAQAGNRGWSYKDVLPYFKKLETFEDGKSAGRGSEGPLNIVRVKERPALGEAFIKAGLEAGFPRNDDYNSGDQEGFGHYQVNQKDGRRWSAASAYLGPARRRANLKVVVHAMVERLVLGEGRVTGVEYMRGGVRHTVAAGEVILSAGAVQSPQLLELSGIGAPEVLKPLGIEVRHALQGVGANYFDHYCTRMNWRVNKPVTLNEQTRGLSLMSAVAQYFLTRNGILTLGTGLSHGFVKTSPDLDAPDVQYFFMHASYANAADRKLDHQPGMTVGVSQMRPKSHGTIHIKSSDPRQGPSIRPNFLSVQDDVRVLVEGMKIARRIVNQPAIASYVASEMSPGKDVNTDAEWEHFARETGQSIYHPVGTCAMGNGPAAVVDDRLRVHGLRGLRVVDASVMPTQVSGNTMLAVVMVAEKAADLILEDRKVA